MAENDTVTDRPFTTFNFRVGIEPEGSELCEAAFSECDGLEMTMEPKTHREGGNNVTQHQLVGPVTYGTLTLKRGMTKSFDLWEWFNRVNEGEYSLRAKTTVEMLSSTWSGDDETAESESAEGTEGESGVNARFELFGCLPIKLRAPSLNATDGGVAIEELQISYERMDIDLSGSDSE